MYRTLFEKIEAIEIDSSESVDFIRTTFGYSHTPYEPVVSNFYQNWMHFSSNQSFAYADKYRLSEAPNRQVRRLMEKDNKKMREAERKKFNDTVRSLVEYIRKRDKRYLDHLEKVKKSSEEREKRLKEEREKQKKKQIEMVNDFVVQDWAKVDEVYDDELLGEEIANDGFFCIACEKVFKSDRQ